MSQRATINLPDNFDSNAKSFTDDGYILSKVYDICLSKDLINKD